MKRNIYFCAFLALGLGLMSFAKIASPSQGEAKIVGTYVGIDDNGYFVFTLKDNTSVVFEEADYDIGVDLYDEQNETHMFQITWKKVQIEEYDDDGEPTGETTEGKRIINLKELDK